MNYRQLRGKTIIAGVGHFGLGPRAPSYTEPRSF